MEDKAKRLKRFQNGSSVEIILTLLNSIANFFNNRELDIAASSNLWLLVILGIHAVALTISHGLFNKDGHDGFRLFLKNFMDTEEEGFNFSEISKEIHTYRNIVAHRWLSDFGYDFGLDFEMRKGWEKRGEVIYLNPKLYYEAYKNAFGRGGKIWDYDKLLTEEQAEKAKERLIEKYQQ